MPLMKNEALILPASPSGLKVWILAARPKTLIAGLSPVLIGGAFASRFSSISLLYLALALLFSMTLQIGTNWANDYFDYVKGADTSTRKGPTRAVQAGWIAPKKMRNAALIAFALAALFAIPLLFRIGLFYLPLMLLCIGCGILYTGGKRPLGYLGLGDLLVLFFYGPVATCCTVLALLLFVPPLAFLISFVPGCLSCAILAINNLRDEEEDRQAGKITLVARFGKRFGQWEYTCCLLIAGVVPFILVSQGMPVSLFTLWLLLPLFKEPLQIVFYCPAQLNRAFALTARLLIFYTLLFSTLLTFS